MGVGKWGVCRGAESSGMRELDGKVSVGVCQCSLHACESWHVSEYECRLVRVDVCVGVDSAGMHVCAVSVKLRHSKPVLLDHFQMHS